MKSKDGRAFRAPPEAEHAGNLMKDYASNRSVALILRGKSPEPESASATCVRIGERFFLATAAHCIDPFRADEIELLPRGEFGRPGIPFIQRSAPRANESELDIAWLELDAVEVQRSGLSAVELENLGFSIRSVDECAYLIQGYPAAEVSAQPDGSFRPLSLCITTIGRDLKSPFGIAAEYPPQDRLDVGLELVHPKGFSGGGLWTFHLLTVWPHISCESEKLCGIVFNHSLSDKALETVSIEHWLRKLLADIPELSSNFSRAEAAT